MSLPRILISSLAVLLGSACISLPDVDSPQDDAGVPTSPADSGQIPPDGGGPGPDGGDGPDASTPTNLTVSLLAPSETVFTKDTVDIQVQVMGGTADRVDLLVDDEVLTTLVPPYTYQWSTKEVAEGSHHLTVRALLADKTFTSAAREVVVDRTPPQVTSRAPAPGTQDVWVRQPIEATFSEPVKASTLTHESVRLAADTADVTATVSLSNNGTKLSVTPSSRIPVPSAMELTLSSTITDAAGNALAMPGVAWTWKLPQAFSVGTLSASSGDRPIREPLLQFDTQGGALVTWTEGNLSGMFDLYASQWTINSWQALGGHLNSSYAVNQGKTFKHSAKFGTNGNPTIAWVQMSPSDSSKSDLHVQHWTGEQWVSYGDSSLNHQSTGGGRPQEPSLQLDSGNNPIVAWMDDGPNTLGLINVWRWSGETWGGVGSAQISAPRAYSHSLEWDHSNKLILAWRERGGSANASIHVHRWSAGTWSKVAEPLEFQPPTSATDDNHSFLIDGANSPVAAYIDSDGASQHLRVKRWTGIAWDPLGQALSSSPEHLNHLPAHDYQLQVNSHGTIFIAWLEDDPTRTFQSLRTCRWTGSMWESIDSPVIPKATQSIDGMSFRISPSGALHVAVALNNTGGGNHVHVLRYNY